MGFILDSIIKKKFVEGPLAVSADFTTEFFDISGQEGSLSIQIDYSGGVGLDMDIYLEVSVNSQSFVRIDESLQNVTDDFGTHVYDLSEVGVAYIRVALVVNSGTLNIDEIQLSAKRRH